MEFHEKLQELRKKEGMTQEELAQVLHVSRAAVSKWESGRGYPNIDSLKAIAWYFSVTVDELLSGDQVLTIAEEDGKQKENRFRDLAFGLLDISFGIFFFLPLFAQRSDGSVREVSLLSLTGVAPYLKISYLAAVAALVVWGVLTLALQNCAGQFWLHHKNKISLVLNTGATLLFIISMQPYGAAFLFVFLVIKALMLIKTS